MRKQIAKIFYRLSILFDRSYARALENAKKYEDIDEMLTRDLINILDVMDGAAHHGDLTNRIQYNTISTTLAPIADSFNLLSTNSQME